MKLNDINEIYMICPVYYLNQKRNKKIYKLSNQISEKSLFFLSSKT